LKSFALTLISTANAISRAHAVHTIPFRPNRPAAREAVAGPITSLPPAINTGRDRADGRVDLHPRSCLERFSGSSTDERDSETPPRSRPRGADRCEQ
jgi:hypothetical protein